MVTGPREGGDDPVDGLVQGGDGPLQLLDVRTSARSTPPADRWVFGDRESGAYLLKFAWTKIVRYMLVKGWASPDDPDLTGYWAARQRRSTPPLDRAGLRLLVAQRGRCPLCGDLLLHADRQPQTPAEWEQWLKTVRKATRH